MYLYIICFSNIDDVNLQLLCKVLFCCILYSPRLSPAQYSLNSAESWPKTPVIHSAEHIVQLYSNIFSNVPRVSLTRNWSVVLFSSINNTCNWMAVIVVLHAALSYTECLLFHCMLLSRHFIWLLCYRVDSALAPWYYLGVRTIRHN